MRDTYRSFSSSIEKLADEWAAQCCTSEKWEDLGPFGNSESRPFRVSYEGFVGLAKPGDQKPDGIPRAAHEKIVSDLAYDLRLPVPPVILWDRGSGEAGRERFVSISAWAFSPVFSWDEGSKMLSEEHRKEASSIVSAMLPFESWISAQDRKSDHLLINIEEGRLRLAFIDYAYALSYSWSAPDAPVGKSHSYVPVGQDRASTEVMIDRILQFETERIKNVVRRVPSEWLPEARREVIMSNLLSRRDRIKAIMAG